MRVNYIIEYVDGEVKAVHEVSRPSPGEPDFYRQAGSYDGFRARNTNFVVEQMESRGSRFTHTRHFSACRRHWNKMYDQWQLEFDA